MSQIEQVKRGVVGVVAVAVLVLVGVVGAGAAYGEALSPWWGVTSGARPSSSMKEGLAKDEVQRITVAATAGEVTAAEPISLEEFFQGKIGLAELKRAKFAYNATHEEVQAALESIYGAGNVQVGGGPVGKPAVVTAAEPYVVTFVGGLADRPLPLVNTEELSGGFFGNLQGTATDSEVTKGAGDGQIVVMVENLGDAEADGTSTPVVITDRLPQGLKATAIEAGKSTQEADRKNTHCVVKNLKCTFEGSLAPDRLIEIDITVVVQGDPVAGEENEATVSGGGAGKAVTVRRPVGVGEPRFGVEDSGIALEEANGTPDTQAGSHPFQLTDTILFNQTAGAQPVAMTKDEHIDLPPGLIGNPTPFPRCTEAQFETFVSIGNACPAQTAVGVININFDEPNTIGLFSGRYPVFNIEPRPGEPARFGFLIFMTPVFLDTSVRTGGDYGVTVNVDNITQISGLLGSRTTFWGVPGDPRHDGQRGWECLFPEQGGFEPCEPSKEHNPPPFLSLPTSCTGSLVTSITADSWAEPSVLGGPYLPGEAMSAMDGCNHLPFEPSISVAPDSQNGSTPSGLTVGIHLPQTAVLNPTGIAESTLKDTTVTLPAGVTLNPGTADGLEVCSEAQMGYLPAQSKGDALAFTPDIPSCPDGSKIASVKVTTPLLPNALEGNVFLAAQEANPFGSLFAMYIVARDPVSGTLVKLAGEVKPDPVTGQITATFKNTPQLPFEDLELHFFGGARAPLATPGLCGSYTTGAVFSPWSGEEPALRSSTLDITSGPNASPCQNPLPFSPSLTAGTTSIQAGGFSPFTVTVSRDDGQQSIQSFQLHLPPGLSGLLSGITLCGEAQANAGTCAPNSLIGETTVSVGLGSNPFSVTGGKVYVTGPYNGAPFGISVVVPAKAGPFNFGTVIVRGTIQVDPITGALTVTTNNPAQGYAIPHILDGIPLQIKHVNFTTTRSSFTFNPTNCNPTSVTGNITSIEGSSSPVTVPFQVTNCAILGFKPTFHVSTAGKTSRSTGASLHVELAYPKTPFGSQANIKSVKVSLPKQLPSQLKTLQQACPDSTFNQNPATCGPASRIGTATATTPLIPVTLNGPVYFVSHGGKQFPELVIVLSGYGVTVQLHAETFISKTGITSSTFHTVPDVPVGTFELTLPQGKYPALAAPGGKLCKDKLKMPTIFTAQNGATIKQNTPINVTGCAKKAKKAHRAGRHHTDEHKKK